MSPRVYKAMGGSCEVLAVLFSVFSRLLHSGIFPGPCGHVHDPVMLVSQLHMWFAPLLAFNVGESSNTRRVTQCGWGQWGSQDTPLKKKTLAPLAPGHTEADLCCRCYRELLCLPSEHL